MKSNLLLQKNVVNCKNPAQKAYYAAHVLKAASTNSPSINIQAAIPATAAKPAVVAQTAKPIRPASLPIAATANTIGYAFGELYLNSPAYPIGIAIPAIPLKPASAAVAAVAAVAAIAAVPAIASPAVVAIKGYEDAISIVVSPNSVQITAELPTVTGGGIVGSTKVIIGEVTPSSLRAMGWLDTPASSAFPNDDVADIESETLEQYLYRNALLLPSCIITDVIRNVNGISTSCKRISVEVYYGGGFVPGVAGLQLDRITVAPAVVGS